MYFCICFDCYIDDFIILNDKKQTVAFRSNRKTADADELGLKVQ